MPNHHHTFFYVVFLTLFLSSCTTTGSVEERRARCKQLRADIVFNAATIDTRQSEIERSQRPLQQHSYSVNDCDLCYLQ